MPGFVLQSFKFNCHDHLSWTPNCLPVTELGTLKQEQFSRSVVSDSLRPHRLQHARLSCPSLTPRSLPKLIAMESWCHLTISSSVVPFSSCLQSFPASGSSPVSQFFASGGQGIEASTPASVLPRNIQEWFPLGLTSLILKSKGLSSVFSNTTVQYHLNDNYCLLST